MNVVVMPTVVGDNNVISLGEEDVLLYANQQIESKKLV